MTTVAAEAVRAMFDNPLVEAPERLQPFFANVIYDLDGLDTALGYLSAGIVDDALERMRMWHKEFAHLGFRGWAESYIAEAQRKNQFMLPNSMSAEEQRYLSTWRQELHTLVERSSEQLGVGGPHAP